MNNIDKRIPIRIITIFLVGAAINLIVISYIAFVAASIHLYEIKGLELAFDMFLSNVFGTYKAIIFGSSEPVITLAHEFYLNGKLQGIYWLIYSFYMIKLLFKKNKRFSKENAANHGTHGTAQWASKKEINSRFFQNEKGMLLGEFNGTPCIQPVSYTHLTLPTMAVV